MTILLLGGTADGRRLADKLYQQDIKLIYSVAGLVRKPNLDCTVISGGFTQYGGLKHFIAQYHIRAIVDVTHPYAQTMSNTAVEAAKHCQIPCWRFHRLPWQAQAGDQWLECQSFQEAIPLLQTKQSLFLSAGQLTQAQLEQLLNGKQRLGQQQLLRTAAPPKLTMPESMQWVKAIGPFDEENELQLLKDYHIDMIFSKNSGGDATVAKLHAARALQIPVVMLQRPELNDADKIFHSLLECEHFVLSALQSK